MTQTESGNKNARAESGCKQCVEVTAKKYTAYICVDAIGELIKPNYVTDHFKVVLKEKGLKPVRFHDLRHSCASLLLANGVPMKMIQDWLGHSDMGTTLNIKNPYEQLKRVKTA